MSPLIVSKYTLAHPPRQPFTVCLVWLAFDQCLCYPTQRDDFWGVGGAWDWRESLVHAPMLFMNGPNTGVDSGSLCMATMACDSNYRHTGSQGPDIKEEDWGKRDYSTDTCCTQFTRSNTHIQNLFISNAKFLQLSHLLCVLSLLSHPFLTNKRSHG